MKGCMGSWAHCWGSKAQKTSPICSGWSHVLAGTVLEVPTGRRSLCRRTAVTCWFLSLFPRGCSVGHTSVWLSRSERRLLGFWVGCEVMSKGFFVLSLDLRLLGFVFPGLLISFLWHTSLPRSEFAVCGSVWDRLGLIICGSELLPRKTAKPKWTSST